MPSPQDPPALPGAVGPATNPAPAGAAAASNAPKDKPEAAGKPADDKSDFVMSVTKGLDEPTRRRISYVLLGFGIGLVIVSVGAILLKADIARNALGIPIAAGLAIIFVGFLGGRAGWEIKAISLSLGGSIAAFAGVYQYFFHDGDNAECAFSVPCRTPKIALQFVHTDEDQGLSAVIMDCLRVRSGTVDWEKVEIEGASSTIPNGNQYFLHKGQVGGIEISGKSDPTCSGPLGAIRFADSKEVYRVQHLSQMGPPGERPSYEVTYLSSKLVNATSDEAGKRHTKMFHAGELIVVTIYLAPFKSNKTN